VIRQRCSSRGSSGCTDYNDWIIIDDSKQNFVAKPFHIDEVSSSSSNSTSSSSSSFVAAVVVVVVVASTFQRLRKIWSNHSISLDTKLRLYTSIVIPTVLHTCETWKSTLFNIRQKLGRNERCLRTILGMSWRDHISNDEVLRRVDLGSLFEIVR